VHRRDGRLLPGDGALIAAGRSSARLVDDTTSSEDAKAAWMREAAVRRHVETLRELGMTPGSRPGTVHDPLLEALAAFTTQQAGYFDDDHQPDHPATDPDEPHPT